MSIFPVNDDLFIGAVCGVVKFMFDALLQTKHYRAGGVNDFNVVLLGQFVSFRWFSMSTEQYLYIVQACEFFVIDGNQSHFFQTFAFLSVVYDVAKAIKGIAFSQFFFGFPDGGRYSEAETGT